MLVKAVAHHTTAAFIRVVGSEFVQKYLGEGPRMVRDVFRLARENAPAIIFIDEVDAIATKRFDAQTGADREVQRILIELLTQMDGFDQGTNVKVWKLFKSGEPPLKLQIGHHGYQSSGYFGSRFASSRSSGPKDRIPSPKSTREASYLPNCNWKDEPWS
jgi:ATPase family associated with various cellular activities (AAA)